MVAEIRATGARIRLITDGDVAGVIHTAEPEKTGIDMYMGSGGAPEGVIAAVRDVGLGVPLVVRLEGTNVERGKQIIAESGLNVISADDLDDAARKVVAAVRAAA